MAFLNLKNPLILAPMADVTNVAFRLLCKEMGAAFAVTEFASAEGVTRNIDNKRIKVVPEERPVAIQFFGSDEVNLLKSIELVKDKCDCVDINFGCPSSKVMACGGGAAYLGEPQKIYDVLKPLCETGFPITCKIRAGLHEKKITAVEVACMAEKAGVKMITIHGRTKQQGYSGKADWEIIKKVKDNVGITVVGNGDVSKPEHVVEIMKQTGCDYVMIGRAAIGDPHFFKRCLHYLETSEVLPRPSFEEQMKILFKYFDLLKKFKLDELHYLKKCAQQFSKGYEGSAKLRDEISRVESEEALFGLLKAYA